MATEQVRDAAGNLLLEGALVETLNVSELPLAQSTLRMQDIPSGLINLANAAYGQNGFGSNFTILVVGDSMAGETNGLLVNMERLLKKTFGDGGCSIGRASGGPESGATFHTGGTAADAVLWPTGDYYSVPADGTVRFGLAGGHHPVLCNQMKVYYIQEPGAGTFKVQTELDASGVWTDEIASVDCDGDLAGAVASVSLKSTARAYRLRIVGLSGAVKIIGVEMTDRTRACAVSIGLIQANSGQGGDFVDADGNFLMGGTAQAILSPILAEIAPRAIIYTSRDGWSSTAPAESGSPGYLDYRSYLSWQQLRTRWATAYAQTDWIVVGGPPSAFQESDDFQRLANREFRRWVEAHPADAYFDGYAPFRSGSFAHASGALIDGTHLSAKGVQKLTASLFDWLSINSFAGPLHYKSSGNMIPAGQHILPGVQCDSLTSVAHASWNIHRYRNSVGALYFRREDSTVCGGLLNPADNDSTLPNGFVLLGPGGSSRMVLSAGSNVSWGYEPPIPVGQFEIHLNGGNPNGVRVSAPSGYTGDLQTWRVNNAVVGKVDKDGLWWARSFAKANLPVATGKAGAIVFVSDETGGPTLAFSDGTDWKRVSDLATVS